MHTRRWAAGRPSVAFPVQVGTEPTATPRDRPGTPVIPTITVSTTCSSSANASPVAAANASAASVQPTPRIDGQPPAIVAVNQQAPVLQLANPSPGDTLEVGASVLAGVIYDPASPEGSGIDRIDIFLGSRDAGGAPIGSANTQDSRAFQVTIRVPRNPNGAHDLVAYAHSTVTGNEGVVSVPIFVGMPPTPTPRPK